MHRVFLAIILALGWISAVETSAVVARVIDGDTIEVDLPNGGREKVRLLCVDTPEIHDNQHGPGTPEGVEAKKFLAGIAQVGQEVRLYDDKPDLQRDKYGRLLAVVLLGRVGNVSAQAMLIAMGHSAYWTKYGEAPGRFRYDFASAQESAAGVKEARSEKAGKGRWLTDPAPMLAVARDGDFPSIDPATTYAAWLSTMTPLWIGDTGRGSSSSITDAGSISSQMGRMPPTATRVGPPLIAGNGDIRGMDNDGDGRAETVFVKGFTRKDGTTVQSQFRAPPRK